MNIIRKGLLFLAFLPVSLTGFGQKFLIEGTLRDSETRQPISSASIILKNSGRGTSSDDKGVFKLELTGFPSVLFVQCMGYIRDTIVIESEMNNIYFRDVHLDAGTGRIYIEYPQGAFTHFIEINPETGQEIRRFMVWDFTHIEKCQFLNGRLYFLYQPDTGKRIKKVYSIWI